MFDGRGDLFIHLRTAGKDLYPSHWDTCAGGVPLAGEDFAAGAARELAEELGVQTPLEELFPFRWTDERTDVHGMVYRARHDGPFRLQPEEVVRGEFVPPRSVAERARRDLVLSGRARRPGRVSATRGLTSRRRLLVSLRISDGRTSMMSRTAPMVRRSSPSTP